MPEIMKCATGDRDNTIYRNDQDIDQDRRLRFWQIANFFKCPVVGLCLTVSEQKQLLKKTDLYRGTRTLFGIHEILVASSDNENRLSIRIDNLLDRKFGRNTKILHELCHEEFMAHCRAAFKRGDYLCELWAAATRPGLPVKYRNEVFGEVHMMMHLNGGQALKMTRKLTEQGNELENMRLRIKEAARTRRALQKDYDCLKQELAGLRTALASMEKAETPERQKAVVSHDRCDVVELERENSEMKDRMDALVASLEEVRRKASTLEKKNILLSSDLERERELGRRFREEAKKAIENLFTVNRCDPSCPAFDLCRKRILIVGGITRMESLYRELIEGSGGIFEYHDGYMKRGVKRLESCLRRADVVLCPVSCNSHVACSLVKKLGKKHRKPVHMLNNFSLSAISQVIWGGGESRSLCQ